MRFGNGRWGELQMVRRNGSKLLLANFRFTKFVVIESLESKEVSTGKELGGYISAMDSFKYLQIPLEFHDCPNAQRLREVLTQLTVDAKKLGSSPILHIECHGSDFGDGLVLANGEAIPWSELAPLLEALNLATQFNLLVFLAACNAFYFIEEMSSIRPSPVYAIVAPSDTLDPAEVMRGTRTYYRTLFESGDAGIALNRLKSETLTSGRWFGKTAEEWFEETLVNYVEKHCSTKQIADRARQLYQSQPSINRRRSVGNLKRGLQKAHKDFVEKYFQDCFHTSDVPSNLKRFEALRRRVDARVRGILASRGYET